MIVVKELAQTCSASPAQWEGVDNEGNSIYVRYRWGYLSIEKNHEEILGKDIGHRLDGKMTFTQLQQATQGSFVWPTAVRDATLDKIE
jgi:hypothetical protein